MFWEICVVVHTAVDAIERRPRNMKKERIFYTFRLRNIRLKNIFTFVEKYFSAIEHVPLRGSGRPLTNILWEMFNTVW